MRARLRAPGAWWFSLRASGPSFGSQRSGPESASRGTRPPGEIIPEWWATSSRNGGRDHLGIGGRHHPGMRGGFTRNRQLGGYSITSPGKNEENGYTSSARPRSGSGTVRPSGLVVLRLRNSSTLVDG